MAQTKVTVGNTTTSVLAANTGRGFLSLVNDSDTVIYLKFGEAAVMNEGIRLNASGGSMVISQRDFLPEFLGSINAIASAGSKNLCVFELNR